MNVTRQLVMRSVVKQSSRTSNISIRSNSTALFSLAKAATGLEGPLSSRFEQRRGMARGARARKPQPAKQVCMVL